MISFKGTHYLKEVILYSPAIVLEAKSQKWKMKSSWRMNETYINYFLTYLT